MSNSLESKVTALPEVYQPIFGHPELAQMVSRSCEDRLVYLGALHDALATELGRPVRVLDLGCAQGYICLSLAARGAHVVGVDFLEANIDVCRMLAQEHPEFVASFHRDRLENFVGKLEDDAYDLVLGLSVFHHVAHEHGAEAASVLVDKLAHCVRMGAFELAQADEPLYWAGSQPREARDLLRGYDFIHEMARFSTHLSQVERPLYVVSKQYWFLGGKVASFERAEHDSHALARGTHQSTRTYFFGNGRMAKLVRFVGERADYNRTELQREIAALTGRPDKLDALWPMLRSHGIGAHEGWLVRDLADGVLLLDAIMQGQAYEPRRIVREVLHQLAALEQAGLYHNDVRVWNVLLTPEGGALLIDYGAVGDTPVDCSWPDDLFLAFFIFVHNVATFSVSPATPTLPPFISPANLPAPYNAWLADFWTQPRASWSFLRLAESFDAMASSAPDAHTADDGQTLWVAAVERHLAAASSYVVRGRHEVYRDLNAHAAAQRDLAHGLSQLTDRHEALDGTVVNVGRLLGAVEHQMREMLHVHEERSRLLAAEQANLLARLETAELRYQQAVAELETIYQSRSFRITRPLRAAGRVARRGRSLVGRGLRPIWHRSVRLPLTRRMVLALAGPFPRLRERLAASIAAHERQGTLAPGTIRHPVALSTGANDIHQRLQRGLKEANAGKGEGRAPGH